MAALVTGAFGAADRRPGAFPGGAALLGASAAWVLLDDQPLVGLGPALAWARQHEVEELHVVVDDAGDAGTLARRAARFARPPAVWQAVDRDLVRAEPAPFPPDPVLPASVQPFFDVLAAAGADPVVEHGVLTGEILGLEIARVETDGDEPRLEVGVGRHDREAFAMLHGSLPTVEALVKVVTEVRRHRRPGAEPHPLNRLSPERWLRATVMATPALVGADHLAPMAPTVPRRDLRARQPAPATGSDLAGRPLVVVCSSGVDLDLVPAAADARLRDGRGARLVLALPKRDDLPVTRALAAALTEPAEVVALDL